jgi:hypothetical protein
LPLLLAATLAGCASSGTWSGEIEPAGFVAIAGESFEVTVGPAEPEDRGDFAGDYAAALSDQIESRLRGAGFRTGGGGTRLEVRITWIAPGGAWGEEAECHLDISILRETGKWSFKVIGYSGSTWGRDRIPTALAQAAAAVVAQIEAARE